MKPMPSSLVDELVEHRLKQPRLVDAARSGLVRPRALRRSVGAHKCCARQSEGHSSDGSQQRRAGYAPGARAPASESSGATGRRDEVALAAVAAEFEQLVDRVDALDPLGDDPEVEGLAESDDRLDDGPVVGVRRDALRRSSCRASSRLTGRCFSSVIEAVARPEVVDRDLDAERLESPAGCARSSRARP